MAIIKRSAIKTQFLFPGRSHADEEPPHAALTDGSTAASAAASESLIALPPSAHG